MSFYMNYGTFNEGEQAEAYKKKKAEEKAAQDVEDRSKAMNRMLNKDKALTYNDPIGSYKKVRDAAKKYNSRRIDDAERALTSTRLPTDREVADGINADNAIMRKAEKDLKSKGEGINHNNMRRPEWYKECGIFDECTFLEESSWDDIKKARN